MDVPNNSSPLPQVPPAKSGTEWYPRKPFPTKVFMMIGGVVLIGIIGVGIAVLAQKKSPATTQVAIEPNLGEQALPTSVDTKREPLAIVTDVYTAIANGEYDQVLPYFYIDEKNNLTKEQVLQLLADDKKGLSDSSGYHPTTSPRNVMVASDKAQVLVSYQKSGKVLTARYDMQQIQGTWKIMIIAYNKPLDLLQVAQQEQATKQIMTKATYSASPATFALPNGDSVVVDQTLIRSGTDIYVHAENFKSNYVLAVYEAPNIRTIEHILAGKTGQQAIQILDYQDIEETGGGLILFYPEGTQISQSTSGNPPGALLQIPIKIQN